MTKRDKTVIAVEVADAHKRLRQALDAGDTPHPNDLKVPGSMRVISQYEQETGKQLYVPVEYVGEKERAWEYMPDYERYFPQNRHPEWTL